MSCIQGPEIEQALGCRLFDHGAVVIEIIERRRGHVHEPDEAELRVPFKVGVAFVPDTADPQFRLPESERIKLAAGGFNELTHTTQETSPTGTWTLSGANTYTGATNVSVPVPVRAATTPPLVTHSVAEGSRVARSGGPAWRRLTW